MRGDVADADRSPKNYITKKINKKNPFMTRQSVKLEKVCPARSRMAAGTR